VEKRRLPKIWKNETKTRNQMFKKSLRINTASLTAEQELEKILEVCIPVFSGLALAYVVLFMFYHSVQSGVRTCLTDNSLSIIVLSIIIIALKSVFLRLHGLKGFPKSQSYTHLPSSTPSSSCLPLRFLNLSPVSFNTRFFLLYTSVV
jgi:Polo kinase kinase